jgi:hypothetical protein
MQYYSNILSEVFPHFSYKLLSFRGNNFLEFGHRAELPLRINDGTARIDQGRASRSIGSVAYRVFERAALCDDAVSGACGC